MMKNITLFLIALFLVQTSVLEALEPYEIERLMADTFRQAAPPDEEIYGGAENRTRKLFYASGELMWQLSLNGQNDISGDVVMYYKNGNKLAEYEQGNELLRIYYENGQLLEERSVYKSQDFVKKYFPAGQLMVDKSFDDHEWGRSSVYDEEGDLRFTIECSLAERFEDGYSYPVYEYLVNFFDSSGNITDKVTFTFTSADQGLKYNGHDIAEIVDKYFVMYPVLPFPWPTD